MVVDVVVLAETERNSTLSHIVDLDKELEFVKDSNKDLKKKYKDLESAGKKHDEEIVALLDPVARGLSGKQSDQPLCFLSPFFCLVYFIDRFSPFYPCRGSWNS